MKKTLAQAEREAYKFTNGTSKKRNASCIGTYHLSDLPIELPLQWKRHRELNRKLYKSLADSQR
jgi:hypothetical protein